ncbi:hypothetical protein Q0Z83_080750 [Actinoplanes sichuanensis]|uniref:Uncharacterized protein n=1 Tax=Actinoplanes sichuanensis TaxID=512349 RepID=A0ABW4ACU7_9ACTN|nr:hypothetical protein [Actinoplanes sichuanensis]BEL09884.1 hypothetical protein Q0Z83_080750 [Actinoplanes sichuanensis]
MIYAWWERNRTWAPYPLTVLLIGLFFTGRWTVKAFVELFRLVSGGDTAVMSAAGWVFYMIPFALVWTVILTSGRAKNCLVILVFLTPVTLSMFPGDTNYWLAEAVSGPGGNAFVVGMRNGALAGIITSFTVPFVLANDRLRDHFGLRTLGWMLVAPVGALLASTLVAAVILAAS